MDGCEGAFWFVCCFTEGGEVSLGGDTEEKTGRLFSSLFHQFSLFFRVEECHCICLGDSAKVTVFLAGVFILQALSAGRPSETIQVAYQYT